MHVGAAAKLQRIPVTTGLWDLLTNYMTKIFCLSFSLLILVARDGMGQQYQHFRLNAGVNATTSDKQAVLTLWDTYLGSQFKNQPQFWAPAELKKYPKGDLLLSEGYVNPSVYQYATQKIVLSIEPVDSAQYRCRTLFYWQNPVDAVPQLTVFCIVNTYFQRQQARWLLVNNLTHYTRDWTTDTVGYLTYRLRPARVLDRTKAAQAHLFLTRLFHDFDISPFPVTYYLATDCEEVHRMKGFDYVVGMGSDKVCGFYDEVNHLVYAGGLGEGYLHELVHVINPYFPKAHPLLLTGYSALRGGHFGHDLAYHKKRVRAYLTTHAIDLQNPLAFTALDEQTNPQYVIGAIFCEAALKAGGLAKLKRLFSYGISDEAFYTALKQEFKLDKKDLPRFIERCLRTD